MTISARRWHRLLHLSPKGLSTMLRQKEFLRTAVPLLLGVAITCASGFMHGRMNRRQDTEASIRAAQLLQEIPHDFGEWELAASPPLSSGVVAMLDCEGSIQRVYSHKSTGQSVTVAVLLGPPETIWAHLPDSCYPFNTPYTVSEPRQAVPFRRHGSPDETFWALTFRSGDVHGNLLRCYYAWSDGRAWCNPAEPRFQFGGRSYLYKLQVAAHLPPHSDTSRDDPCREFLQSFLPVLHPRLVAQ
jgi:hypothetical protein